MVLLRKQNPLSRTVASLTYFTFTELIRFPKEADHSTESYVM